LDYLTGLASDSRHILAGQHTSYWDSNPLDYVSALKSQTGTQPAILGTTLSAADIPKFGLYGSSENGVALSNQWLAAGGIVQLSLWPGNPQTMSGSQTDFDITCADVLTPGNATYTNWQDYLAALVAKVKQINGPIILRPFVETNGRWFWWGNNCSSSQQVQIWQQMWNYFAAAGVNNVLWEFNVNGGVGNYTADYPGSDYVDIVSFDSYPPTSRDSTWYAPLAALGKPVILAESGPSPYPVGIDSFDNDDILQVVKSNFPKIVGIVIWCQTQALSQQQGDEAFMTDSAILNLTDLAAAL
jgi:mannan endo-1,4-beta-mannosidase